MPRYDANFAIVEPGLGTPCPPTRWGAVPTSSELVLFESAAVLPRFILSLTKR